MSIKTEIDSALYGAGSTFPVAVAPLHAQQFSKTLSKGGNFFGLDVANAAQTLRAIADALDSEQINLQTVEVKTTASHDDFLLTDVAFRFAEKGTVLL